MYGSNKISKSSTITDLTNAQILALTNVLPGTYFVSTDGIWYYTNEAGIPTPITFDLGNYVYVSTNGSNVTGEKGNISRPFRDPWYAKTIAVSGDAIYVFSGEYTSGGLGTGADIEDDGTDQDATSLWKDGVTYFFDAGAILKGINYNTGENIALNQPFFYHTGASAEVCRVIGKGEFYSEWGIVDSVLSGGIQTTTHLVDIDNVNADFFMEGRVFSGADIGISIKNIESCVIKFDRGLRGWRNLLSCSATSGNLYFEFNIVDGSVRDSAKALLSFGGIDGNSAGTVFVQNNGENAKVTFKCNNAYIEGTSLSLFQFWSFGPSENAKIVMNADNVEVLDAVKLYNPNTQATGLYTIGTPIDGDTFTVGAKTYTWRTVIDDLVPNEILIGASATARRDSARSALSGEFSNAGVSNATTYNADVLGSNSGNNLALRARVGGTGGNSIVTSATGAGSMSAATLLGGLNDGANRAATGTFTSGVVGTFTGTSLLDASLVINLNLVVSELPLLNWYYAHTINNFKFNLNVNQCVVDTAGAALHFSNSTLTSATNARVNINANILQEGEGPIVIVEGTPYPTANHKITLSGVFDCESTTNPVISNTSTASINDLILKNLTLISGTGNCITNTNAQNYRVMSAFANVIVDANTTELVQSININPNVV